MPPFTSPKTPTSTPFEAVIPTTCTGTAAVVSPYNQRAAVVSMDVILSIYRELVNLINKLPFKQHLVVCIVFRGSKFRLDLGEGECRATPVFGNWQGREGGKVASII